MPALSNKQSQKVEFGKPRTANGLPKFSIVLTRGDGVTTAVTIYPDDADVRNMTASQFLQLHVEPMLGYARGRYKGEIP